MTEKFPANREDRASWARLWSVARLPWSSDAALGRALGVGSSAVGNWRRGDRTGPWAALRGALHRGRSPRSGPRARHGHAIVEELLGVRGDWHPEPDGDDDDDGSLLDTFTQLIMAGTDLVNAEDEGATEGEIIRLTERVRGHFERFVRIARRRAPRCEGRMMALRISHHALLRVKLRFLLAQMRAVGHNVESRPGRCRSFGSGHGGCRPRHNSPPPGRMALASRGAQGVGSAPRHRSPQRWSGAGDGTHTSCWLFTPVAGLGPRFYQNPTAGVGGAVAVTAGPQLRSEILRRIRRLGKSVSTRRCVADVRGRWGRPHRRRPPSRLALLDLTDRGELFRDGIYWSAPCVPPGLNRLGDRVKRWQDEQFEPSLTDQALVLCEEAGEVARAVVKGKQRIRPQIRGPPGRTRSATCCWRRCPLGRRAGIDVEAALHRRLQRCLRLDFTADPEGGEAR